MLGQVKVRGVLQETETLEALCFLLSEVWRNHRLLVQLPNTYSAGVWRRLDRLDYLFLGKLSDSIPELSWKSDVLCA